MKSMRKSFLGRGTEHTKAQRQVQGCSVHRIERQLCCWRTENDAKVVGHQIRERSKGVPFTYLFPFKSCFYYNQSHCLEAISSFVLQGTKPSKHLENSKIQVIMIHFLFHVACTCVKSCYAQFSKGLFLLSADSYLTWRAPLNPVGLRWFYLHHSEYHSGSLQGAVQ